jgi:hypothetical protein
MIIISHTDKHRVYAEWLKSELYRRKVLASVEEISLIENPDLRNDDQNAKREMLLLREYNRAPILHRLPAAIDWNEVRTEAEDTEKLFLLPVFDWYLDSGRTFRLADVAGHLSPHRGSRIPGVTITGSHWQKIAAMALPQEGLGYLIVISTRTDGPYTIIDGVHRAVKRLLDNNLTGASCFLGLAGDLSQCSWSIERDDLQKHLQGLDKLVEQGIIW